MNDVDIVINNIGGGEDVIKRKSKNKIINVIITVAIVSLFAFGLVSYKGLQKQNETITSEATEVSYVQSIQCDYVLNTNTMKAHQPTCWYADKIGDENREDYHGTIEELQDKGYSLCKYCHAW